MAIKRLYTVTGEVTKGKNRGKALGFPTANFPLTCSIPSGIYVSESVVDGHTYQSVTFIGSAKTFGEEDKKVETYILDFSSDIYGKSITVLLYKKIRGNKRFESIEELVKTIKKDVEKAKDFFRKNSTGDFTGK